MGQYREWLHYRETDQKLQAQLARLEQELANLQERAHHLAGNNHFAENRIIQALLQQQAATAANPPAPAAITEQSPAATEQEVPIPPQPIHPIRTISPALFAWSRLPNLDTQVRGPALKPTALAALPVNSTPETDLLPADINTFIDEHSEATESVQPPEQPPRFPQPDLPSNHFSSRGLVDQQTERTNQLVQRWIERWGRQAHESQPAQEEGTHE